MQIKMLKTTKGAEDGIHISMYEKDREYEVSDIFGNILIKHKFAEKIVPESIKSVVEKQVESVVEKQVENADIKFRSAKKK